jgi:hypothetical protein
MSEAKSARGLWYTRRDGVVRGPYPARQISRYILLGRIRECDELRHGDGDWAGFGHYPELVPEVMKLPPTAGHLRELALAKLRADERGSADRRRPGSPGSGLRERRGGNERRRRDILHGDADACRESEPAPANGERYRYTLALGVLAVLCFMLTYLPRPGDGEPGVRECGTSAVPGVNWDGCNLTGLASAHANLIAAHIRNASLDAADLRGAVLVGADLRYSSLNYGTFRGADMSHASLVGVSAQGADLRDVRLNNANLVYADLSDTQLEGADLSGADLSHAIWIDRKPCNAGSVGACRRATPGDAPAGDPPMPVSRVELSRTGGG